MQAMCHAVRATKSLCGNDMGICHGSAKRAGPPHVSCTVHAGQSLGLEVGTQCLNPVVRIRDSERHAGPLPARASRSVLEHDFTRP